MKKLTQEEFIKKAIEKHKDAYDYSKAIYINSRTKVRVICHEKDEFGNEHGEFYQRGSDHLKGQGCPKCASKKISESNRSSLEEFIRKARIIHKDKYDYSKSIYKGSNKKLVIICPKHGEFVQEANSHLSGKGCPQCFNERRGYNFWKNKIKYRPLHFDYCTKEAYKRTFLLTAQKEYNKLKATYKRLETKINNGVINYITKDTYNFIKLSKEKYGEKYDYSKVNYVDSKTPIKLTCNDCNTTFECLPGNHLKKFGCCPICAQELRVYNQRSNTKEFISKSNVIHNNLYDYTHTEYYNELTPVIITCKEHGNFLQVPKDHLQGCGCPKCKNKNQTKLYNILCSKFPEVEILYEVRNNIVPWLGLQRFDIYFPKYNIAVEYDGKQHFVPIDYFGGKIAFDKGQELDKIKEEKCKNNGCHLFRIKYTYKDSDLNNLFININKIIQSYEDTIKRN